MKIKRIIIGCLVSVFGIINVNAASLEITGVSTLKTAIAFGANASGKSNLVKAIALGRQMILLGSLNGPKVTFSPYRLSKEASNRNTRLEYEIQAGRKNYA